MAALYSIKDWEKNFEVSQTRKVENARWVPLPVKHDGLSFRRLMAMDDGQSLFAAWVLIVQVAAKCPVRGVLADEHGPLAAEDLSLKTGCPEVLFKKALRTLSSPSIGWLVVETQLDTSPVPLQERRGQDNTGEDKTEESAPPDGGCLPELKTWIDWWNRLRAESLVASGVDDDPPSQAIVKAWNRVQREAALRAVLLERDKIETAIKQSPFCREGWFRLEKLFGGKNRDGEYIIRKLLDGGYAEKGKRNGPTIGPGQRHDPNARGGSIGTF